MKKTTITLLSGILWGFTALIQLYSVIADDAVVSDVANWMLAGSGFVTIIFTAMYPQSACCKKSEDNILSNNAR